MVFTLTHQGHFYAMSVFPQSLETLEHPNSQVFGEAVETNELLDSCLMLMVASLCGIQSIDNYGHIAKH